MRAREASASVPSWQRATQFGTCPCHCMPHYAQMASDIATCMYYTGIDPFTGHEVYVARGLRDRKLQRALMQFFKPENYFLVREALLKAGRGDLIGSGFHCLIPDQPFKADIEARRRQANEVAEGDHDHTAPTRQRARSLGSGACRIRVTDPAERPRAVARIRGANRTTRRLASATGGPWSRAVGRVPSNGSEPYQHGPDSPACDQPFSPFCCSASSPQSRNSCTYEFRLDFPQSRSGGLARATSLLRPHQ
jgi:hypothetical protein